MVGRYRTWALSFKTSTTASRIPGKRLMAFSTDPAQAAHVIPITQKTTVMASSEPSPIDDDVPFGYVVIDG